MLCENLSQKNLAIKMTVFQQFILKTILWFGIECWRFPSHSNGHCNFLSHTTPMKSNIFSTIGHGWILSSVNNFVPLVPLQFFLLRNKAFKLRPANQDVLTWWTVLLEKGIYKTEPWSRRPTEPPCWEKGSSINFWNSF